MVCPGGANRLHPVAVYQIDAAPFLDRLVAGFSFRKLHQDCELFLYCLAVDVALLILLFVSIERHRKRGRRRYLIRLRPPVWPALRLSMRLGYRNLAELLLDTSVYLWQSLVWGAKQLLYLWGALHAFWCQRMRPWLPQQWAAVMIFSPVNVLLWGFLSKKAALELLTTHGFEFAQLS